MNGVVSVFLVLIIIGCVGGSVGVTGFIVSLWRKAVRTRDLEALGIAYAVTCGALIGVGALGFAGTILLKRVFE